MSNSGSLDGSGKEISNSVSSGKKLTKILIPKTVVVNLKDPPSSAISESLQETQKNIKSN